MKNKKGITLIALVITIVVLIILAGVAINLTLGENGILDKAHQVKQKQSEQEAREKLELVLSNARIEKETNTSYNDDYLNNMLEAKGITVDGDYVIVDNYNYLIDREQLIILDSLGETQTKITAEVQEYLGKNTEGKYEASLLLIVESNAGLQSVVIQNPDGTTFEMETEKVKLGKDMTVELDAEYIVTVTTKDGNTTTRKIVEKSEETISSVTEFVEFRDAVNSGLTYEGKTISLTQDLDLSSVCGEDINGNQVNWEPIGTSTNPFKGTFDGSNNKIANMYIKNQVSSSLFNYIGNTGTVKNITIDNSKIIDMGNASYTGFLATINDGTINQCKVNNNCIVSISVDSTIYLGGIVGRNLGNINECINQANLTCTSRGNVYVGGITGVNYANISNCYNTGALSASTNEHSGVGGINGENQKGTISNCYNIGTIQNGSFKAGISARNGYDSSSRGTINNCFYLNTSTPYQTYENGTTAVTTNIKSSDEMKELTFSATLGFAFIADVQDEEGNYLNNGYPILKWQIGE